uniref:Gustatory receptor n=1 Tax=Tetranychus urticae TaxID=32264 RepID=T1L6B3_TETUR
MPSINMQQCFVRNEELKHYPKVSIESIPSKFQLFISSTSNIYGKCLFVLIMLVINLFYCRELLSLDAVFSFKLSAFIQLLYGNCLYMVFYFRYNRNLVKQINDHWNSLQIDYDYETRKYFWTHTAIYRRLLYVLYTLFFIISCFHPIFLYNGQHNIVIYFYLLVCSPLSLFNRICWNCIYFGLIHLAQTAVEFNLVKLKKMLHESRKDEKSLNINAIKNIRHKYLLSCRLVDKINEIVSPLQFLIFTNLIANACQLSYSLLYNEQNELDKLLGNIQMGSILMHILLYTHLTVKVHKKSQESLAFVYKLSLKTNSMRLLNEISLFLNHNEIGFTFGGMFLLTTSSLSTLFSILTTIIIALPTFAK